jgi:hypothetical protein
VPTSQPYLESEPASWAAEKVTCCEILKGCSFSLSYKAFFIFVSPSRLQPRGICFFDSFSSLFQILSLTAEQAGPGCQ